ncbi:hypothetical protein RJT34_14613 [Clitoria ternatea]|uniref:Uncharacterized protein n=1 Tax=Clitoria ternatea TaxID=43366 RepID=A0AAN9JQR1_CLITE
MKLKDSSIKSAIGDSLELGHEDVNGANHIPNHMVEQITKGMDVDDIMRRLTQEESPYLPHMIKEEFDTLSREIDCMLKRVSESES